jgi:hypothetical protein
LRPNVEASPGAIEAADVLAYAPDDVDALAAFRIQLKKLLADEALARDIQTLWGEAERAGVTNVTVTASGERAIAVGRDLSGKASTGDTHAPPE